MTGKPKTAKERQTTRREQLKKMMLPVKLILESKTKRKIEYERV